MGYCKPCQAPAPTPTSYCVNPPTDTSCGTETVSTGNCSLNADGTPIVTTTSTSGSCVDTGAGLICPSTTTCSDFDLSDETSDTCTVTDYIDEQLSIAGAPMNVYKLLGIYEQNKLLDMTGNGEGISGGYLPSFPPENAFNKFVSEWRSSQTGSAVTSSSYIGYDFGPYKLINGRDKYGLETAVKYDISTIFLKQGCNAENRAKKIRVERSNDGKKWYGCAIVDTGDCDSLVRLNFKKTVESRYWRIRPVDFNGGDDDYWVVMALKMMDVEATNLSNIQDRILMENRDKQYEKTPTSMKCYYTPIDVVANASRFGYSQMEDVYVLQTSFNQTVQILGRPFVIGDIVELPSERQYTPSMEIRKKYLEITDVAWSTSGYTANWKPTLQRLMASPAFRSQETADIYGKMTEDLSDMGVSDNNDGNGTDFQDISDISKNIKAVANSKVPERGQSDAEMSVMSKKTKEYASQFPNLNISKLDVTKNVYSEDALPPNGEPYTESDTDKGFPEKPKHGVYHRVTYKSSGKNIAPRLYKYSSRKNGGWLPVATDKRWMQRKTQPLMQEFVDPATSTVTDPTESGHFP